VDCPYPLKENIDDSGIERLDVLIAEAEARKGTGTKILNDDIGSTAELPYDLTRFSIVQVEAEVPLSRILLHVIKADAANKRQPDASQIAGGRLDLGHVGAEVAERLGAIGTCEHAGEIDHPQSFKRSCGHDQSP
jgi:hypothetical protein